jgi:hypothetical protein
VISSRELRRRPCRALPLMAEAEMVPASVAASIWNSLEYTDG